MSYPCIVVHRELSARGEINGIQVADKIPLSPPVASTSNVFDEILEKIEGIFKRDVKYVRSKYTAVSACL